MHTRRPVHKKIINYCAWYRLSDFLIVGFAHAEQIWFGYCKGNENLQGHTLSGPWRFVLPLWCGVWWGYLEQIYIFVIPFSQFGSAIDRQSVTLVPQGMCSRLCDLSAQYRVLVQWLIGTTIWLFHCKDELCFLCIFRLIQAIPLEIWSIFQFMNSSALRRRDWPHYLTEHFNC